MNRLKAGARKRRTFLLSAIFCLGLLQFSLPARVFCHKSDGSVRVEFSAFGLVCECPFHDHGEHREKQSGPVIKRLVCRDTPLLNAAWSFVEPGQLNFAGQARSSTPWPIIDFNESRGYPAPEFPGRGRDQAGLSTILLC